MNCRRCATNAEVNSKKCRLLEAFRRNNSREKSKRLSGGMDSRVVRLWEQQK